MDKKTVGILIGIFALIAGLEIWYGYNLIQEKQKTSEPPFEPVVTSEGMTIPVYKAESFDLAGNIKGLSKSQIDQHITLYKGYVKKRNQIARDLVSVDRTDAANKTYSPFRSLKLAETYALNGDILHRMYFANLSPTALSIDRISENLKELLEKSFGSIQAFKQDFMDCGGCSRGWVVTAYTLDDGLLHNYVLEEHNQNVPVLSIPLLVLDVYEHAYMIDYGIDRKPYLQVFWEHINWPVVEKRLKWVEAIKDKDAI